MIVIAVSLCLCHVGQIGSYCIPLISPAAEEVLLEEEDEIAEEKSPLDGAWYKRKQNLPGDNRAGQDFFFLHFYLKEFSARL